MWFQLALSPSFQILDISIHENYRSWDKNKNLCLCGNPTFSDSVLGQGQRTLAFGLMLSGPGQAPNFPESGLLTLHLGVKGYCSRQWWQLLSANPLQVILCLVAEYFPGGWEDSRLNRPAEEWNVKGLWGWMHATEGSAISNDHHFIFISFGNVLIPQLYGFSL